MRYGKFKFSRYVIGGQGIGLRVILPFAAFMGIICSIGLYFVVMLPYLGIVDGLKTLPDFRIAYGKIVEPVQKEQIIKLTDNYNAVLNTAIADVKKEEIPQNAFIYITATKVYLKTGMIVSGIDWLPEKVRTCPKNIFTPIELKNVEQGTYNPNKELTRFISMFKLFCVFVGVQMFFVILITFLILWLIVWFLELLLKHGLTGPQLGRLLTMPYCTLVGATIILGLLLKSWYVPWFLFMPYITLNVKLIALIIPVFGDLINLAYKGFSFPFLMKLGWIAGLPLLLIWYFMWVSSIALTRERQKELVKQMNEKAKPREDEEVSE